MLDPQEIYLQSGDPKTEKVAHIYEEYRKELRKANAFDFDDLLLETVRLLKAVPAVRDYYNRRFQYVMVDEYQDTNRPQYELMRLLAGTRHNSVPSAMKTSPSTPGAGPTSATFWSLKKIFPKPRSFGWNRTTAPRKTFCRPRQLWLQTTSSVRARTFGRHARAARRSGTTKLPTAKMKRCLSPTTSRNTCAKRSNRARHARAAVLYRTNSQSRLFEEAMRRYQLKYHVVGGFSFYERAEIKDMISYLKVIQNPDDSISLLRVINTPVVGLARPRSKRWSKWRWRPGFRLWGAIGEAIKRQLLPATSPGSAERIFGTYRGRSGHAGRNLCRAPGETARLRRKRKRLRPHRLDVSAEDSHEDDSTEFDPMAFDFGPLRGRARA